MGGNALAYIIAHKYLGAFLGSLFFAESVVLTIFFTAGRGAIDPLLAFLLTLAGSILSDLFWFFFGVQFLKASRQWDFEKKMIRLMKLIDQKIEKNILISLLIIKFAYGTRFLMVAYFAFKKIPFKQFFIYNLIATLVWLTLLFAIGWSAGSGAINLIPYYTTFQYIVAGLVAMMLTYSLLAKLFIKYMKEKYGHK